MPISPELERAPRKIKVIAASIASLMAANIFTLAYDAEQHHGPTTVVEASLNPQALGGFVLETTTTTLPPTTSVALSPEHASRPRASRNIAPPAALPPTSIAPPITGTHAEWLAEAGVAVGDYNYVDFVFTRESRWRMDAVNAIGCIGFGQNCPDPKTGEKWLEKDCPNWRFDPVCQIRRFTTYALGRYKSWQGARNWRATHKSW